MGLACIRYYVTFIPSYPSPILQGGVQGTNATEVVQVPVHVHDRAFIANPRI